MAPPFATPADAANRDKRIRAMADLRAGEPFKYTREQLEKGMEAANNHPDADKRRKAMDFISSELLRLRLDEESKASPVKKETIWDQARKRPVATALEQLGPGLAEDVLSVGSGVLSTAVGSTVGLGEGLAGIAGDIFSPQTSDAAQVLGRKPKGFEDQAELFARRIVAGEQPIMEAGTYQPRTLGGQLNLDIAGTPQQYIDKLGQTVSGQAMKAGATPFEGGVAGTAVEAPLDLALQELTGRAGQGLARAAGVANRPMGFVPKPTPTAAAREVHAHGGQMTLGQMLGGWWNEKESQARSLLFAGHSVSKGRGRSVESWQRAHLNKALEMVSGGRRPGVRPVKPAPTPFSGGAAPLPGKPPGGGPRPGTGRPTPGPAAPPKPPGAPPPPPAAGPTIIEGEATPVETVIRGDQRPPAVTVPEGHYELLGEVQAARESGAPAEVLDIFNDLIDQAKTPEDIASLRQQLKDWLKPAEPSGPKLLTGPSSKGPGQSLVPSKGPSPQSGSVPVKPTAQASGIDVLVQRANELAKTKPHIKLLVKDIQQFVKDGDLTPEEGQERILHILEMEGSSANLSTGEGTAPKGALPGTQKVADILNRMGVSGGTGAQLSQEELMARLRGAGSEIDRTRAQGSETHVSPAARLPPPSALGVAPPGVGIEVPPPAPAAPPRTVLREPAAARAELPGGEPAPRATAPLGPPGRPTDVPLPVLQQLHRAVNEPGATRMLRGPVPEPKVRPADPGPPPHYQPGEPVEAYLDRVKAWRQARDEHFGGAPPGARKRGQMAAARGRGGPRPARRSSPPPGARPRPTRTGPPLTVPEHLSGREAVDFTHDVLEQEFGRSLSRMRADIDNTNVRSPSVKQRRAGRTTQPSLRQELDGLRTMLASPGVFTDPAALTRAQGMIALVDRAFAAGPRISGRSLQTLVTRLRQNVEDLLRDPHPEMRHAGQLGQELQNALDRTLSRDNTAAARADYLRARNAWAIYKPAEHASAATTNADAVPSANQILRSIKQQDRSMGKGRFARGHAGAQVSAGAGRPGTIRAQEMAQQGNTVYGREYPDSGTPGRHSLLHAASHPLSTALGALLGIPAAALYSKPVQAALQRAIMNAPKTTGRQVFGGYGRALPVGVGVQQHTKKTQDQQTQEIEAWLQSMGGGNGTPP